MNYFRAYGCLKYFLIDGSIAEKNYLKKKKDTKPTRNFIVFE